MNQQQLQEVYEMVDSISFSRAKKNIHRDFADGLMMAQLIYHFNPKIVSLHNYPPANSLNKKIQNWNILNAKVLKKLGIHLNKDHIQSIVNAIPGVIEQVLYDILLKFQRTEQEGTVSQNAKRAKSGRKSARQKQQQEQQKKRFNQQKENHNNQQQGNHNRHNSDKQAQQILLLVEKIDQATAQLYRLQELAKSKDQIVRNLQIKLQKIMFS